MSFWVQIGTDGAVSMSDMTLYIFAVVGFVGAVIYGLTSLAKQLPDLFQALHQAWRAWRQESAVSRELGRRWAVRGTADGDR
jgi:hypothetical protein